MVNTLNWFEIPATDFARAKAFYATVLDAQIRDDPSPYMQYAYLPSDPQKGGFGGAIACGENFVPAMTGTTVYLDGENDLSVPLGRVESAGGTVILPKTAIGDNRGFYCTFYRHRRKQGRIPFYGLIQSSPISLIADRSVIIDISISFALYS